MFYRLRGRCAPDILIFYFLHKKYGYLENPLDPLNPLDLIKKNVCLYNYSERTRELGPEGPRSELLQQRASARRSQKSNFHSVRSNISSSVFKAMGADILFPD